VSPGVTTLFEIRWKAGMEQPLPTDWGSWGSYSPDGSRYLQPAPRRVVAQALPGSYGSRHVA